MVIKFAVPARSSNSPRQIVTSRTFHAGYQAPEFEVVSKDVSNYF